MFKPKKSIIDDIKRSEPLIETLNVKNAAFDPLTLDKKNAKFMKDNMPTVNKYRHVNY